jgi:hypothetical protein
VNALSTAPSRDLPTVLATSVVRSAHEGESHGGVYLVDLASGACEEVVRWDYGAISWEGRGSERGLRGIAFYEDHVLVAASDEVLIYDQDFNMIDSFRNAYLKHCHEICRQGDVLWLTSTGFDSVLGLDLRTWRFPIGFRLTKAYPRGDLAKRLELFPSYSIRRFDPEGGGPPLWIPDQRDTVHVNNVWAHEGSVLISGTGLPHILEVRDGHVGRFARVPRGTHNAQPFRSGIIANHTNGNQIAYMSRKGRVRRSFPIKSYHQADLLHSSLPADHARQAFGRGLCTWRGHVVVGGSSPATISAFDFDTGEQLACINITMDVRNAIHGLEVWPF